MLPSRMRRTEAADIYRLCARHGLPRPRTEGEEDKLTLVWEGDELRLRLRAYKAAVNLLRVLYIDREAGAAWLHQERNRRIMGDPTSELPLWKG
jgi:hypothetical protein